MIEAGVFGATGYTGLELIGLLVRHPGVRLRFATSESSAGSRLPSVFAGAPDVPLCAPGQAPLDGVDVAFLCLPNGVSGRVARGALAAGARVVDLSADFRLRDARAYEHWYGSPHPAPDLLDGAVYGLTEIARPALPGARLVANPGCYPTSVLLALRPLLVAGAVAGTVIADCKSGVSGAGRTLRQSTQFVEVADNLSPYSIGRAHRHLPEMEQEMALAVPSPPALIFSPHLLPVPRGLLSTLYVPLESGWTEAAARGLLADAYGSEPFIRLLPPGEAATLAHVRGTNRCAIGLTEAAGVCILTSSLDNLLKGASGQAVQNMNVMFGLAEATALVSWEPASCA